LANFPTSEHYKIKFFAVPESFSFLCCCFIKLEACRFCKGKSFSVARAMISPTDGLYPLA